MGATRAFLRASISASTIGDNEIVAAQAGKIIRVYAIHGCVTYTAGGTMRWESSTAGNFLTGIMAPLAGLWINMPWCGVPWMTTVAGESLNLILAGTATVFAGRIIYAVE